MLKRGYQLLKQFLSSDPLQILVLFALAIAAAIVISAEARFQLPSVSTIAALFLALPCSGLMKLVAEHANEAHQMGSDNPLVVHRGLIIVVGSLYLLITSIAAIATYLALSLWEDRLLLTIGIAAVSAALFGTLSWIAASSKWGDPKKR